MMNVKLLLFSQIIFYLNSNVLSQNSTCLTTYSNINIYGNDLNGVQGKPSDCCQFCQQKRGCRAYTWDSFNGGTCWLKNATQPFSMSNGSSTGIMSPLLNETYSLKRNYAAPNFFDMGWTFSHPYGNTNVTKNVNRTVANQLGLIGYQNGKVYMGVDSTNVYNNSGRASVEIKTTDLYNSGLFILSLDHMPTGPGVWPAFWTDSPNWPASGEIDILEGYSFRNNNKVSIHTGENCIMQQNYSDFFVGSWDDSSNKPFLDCYENSNTTANVLHACGIYGPNGTFNTGFNQAGGGVFVWQWDRERFLRVWSFVKPNIPDDILQESPNPNPDTWGLPNAYFPLGPNCTPDHFINQMLAFDIAFCGWWTPHNFPGGEAGCEESVKFHPELYTEAYWLINYLKVFCKPNEPC